MRILPLWLAAATLVVAQLSAQNPAVTNVVRPGNPTTIATLNNFLVMFDRQVVGVDLADFAPITTIPGAFVESFGNNALQLTSGSGATRAYRAGISNFPTSELTIEFSSSGTDNTGTLFDDHTGTIWVPCDRRCRSANDRHQWSPPCRGPALPGTDRL